MNFLCSDFALDFFSGDFAIPENLGEESTTYAFATVDRHHRASAVRVTQEVMTSLDSDDLEVKATKRLDELQAVERWKSAHAMTAIRWTPTN